MNRVPRPLTSKTANGWSWWPPTEAVSDPPSWLLNLQAHPGVGVQIRPKQILSASLGGLSCERERLWPRVNRHNMGLAPIMHPGTRGRYDVYQRHTRREIPLRAARNETRENRKC